MVLQDWVLQHLLLLELVLQLLVHLGQGSRWVL